MTTLVVVPCGSRKIWDEEADAGPTRAKDAYRGAPFKVNREYAEKFSPNSWVILSAKYGFISPDFVIQGNYDVSFYEPPPTSINDQELKRQVRQKGLDRFNRVIILGSQTYADKVRVAFAGTQSRVVAPLEELKPWPPGIRMGAVRSAIQTNRPFDA